MAKKTETTPSSKPKAKSKAKSAKPAKSKTASKPKTAKSETATKSTKTASKPKPALKKKTVAAKVTVRPPDANSISVSHTDIARRAYELFLSRGCTHGRDLDDWLQAETELRG